MVHGELMLPKEHDLEGPLTDGYLWTREATAWGQRTRYVPEVASDSSILDPTALESMSTSAQLPGLALRSRCPGCSEGIPQAPYGAGNA